MTALSAGLCQMSPNRPSRNVPFNGSRRTGMPGRPLMIPVHMFIKCFTHKVYKVAATAGHDSTARPRVTRKARSNGRRAALWAATGRVAPAGRAGAA
ncbi:hypothetical protein GCM10023075_11460 [Streptosporangium album]